MFWTCARATALLCVIFATSVAVGPSSAQTFDIHAPESNRGEVEVESLNAANVGSVRDMRDRTCDSHEPILSYGLRDFWKIELATLVEKPVGDKLRVAKVELENIFGLRSANKEGLGLGWFTSVAAAMDAVTTNSVLVGPIVQ